MKRLPPVTGLAFAIAVYVLLFAVGIAHGQPRAQPIRKNVYEIEPAAKDTIGCAGERTILSGTVLSVELGNRAPHADGSPASIIVAGPTGTANRLDITIAPDTGCGSSGCRVGNQYKIKLRALDSDGNQPICNVVVTVRQEVM